MSLNTIQERLAEFQETITQLKELIERLSTLKFQPGSVPLGSDDENNVVAELSSEINQVLGEAEEELEVLQEEITDLRGKNASDAEHKGRLKEGAARVERDLKSCRTSFRRAQLTARRNLEEAQRLERKLLLASYSASAATSPQNRSGASSPVPAQGPTQATSTSSAHPASHQVFSARDRRRAQQQMRDRHAGSSEDPTVTASSDVTEALRRTHALIADSLARSEFARQTLAESTAALKSLQQSYSGLDNMLASSRDLLGVLLTSQKSDTWYLQTAFYMLLGTLGWLVFRRFLYSPLWWLIWLPLRLVWKSGKAVTAVGSIGGQGGARMEVVNEGQSTRVVDMNKEGAVPTMQVGEQKAEPVGGPDSMLEKVGEVIDGTTEHGKEQQPADSGDAAENRTGEEKDQPNPMKRMWGKETEEREAAKQAQEADADEQSGRIKDEL